MLSQPLLFKMSNHFQCMTTKFAGFQTAGSNTVVNVSEKAYSEVKRKRNLEESSSKFPLSNENCDPTQEEEYPDSFDIKIDIPDCKNLAELAECKNKEEPLQDQLNDSFDDTPPSSQVRVDQSHTDQSSSEGVKSSAGLVSSGYSVGLLTASNKVVAVSKGALEKAKQLFSVDKDDDDSFDKESTPAPAASVSFEGFTTASNRKVVVSDESLRKARDMRPSVPPEEQLSEQNESGRAAPGSASTASFQGFTTASNRTVVVSEESLLKARQILSSVQQEDESSVPPPVASPSPEYPTFSGFHTANNRKVEVSDAALAKSRNLLAAAADNETSVPFSSPCGAKRARDEPTDDVDDPDQKRLKPDADDDVFGGQPDVDTTSLCPASNDVPTTPVAVTTPRPLLGSAHLAEGKRKRGFVSPMLSAVRNIQLSSPSASPQPASLSRPNGSRFVSPLRRPSFVSPLLRAQEPATSPAPLAATSSSPLSHQSSVFNCVSSPVTRPKTAASKLTYTSSEPSTSTASSDYVTIASIAGRQQRLASIIAVVTRVESVGSFDGKSRFSVDLLDETGKISFDLWRKDDELVPKPGDVLVVRSAFVKISPDARPSLTGSVNLSIERDPDLPVTARLKQLNARVQADIRAKEEKAAEAENLYRDLHCIEKMDGTKDAKLRVKGYIMHICMEPLTYFGCCTCRRKMRNHQVTGDLCCQPCGSNDGRHFYVLQCDIADFSGSRRVTVFDTVAAQLIGQDADETAKMVKYRPDELRQQLRSLEFGAPMLFDVSFHEGRWQVDKCASLDFSNFLPFLTETAVKKGYRL